MKFYSFDEIGNAHACLRYLEHLGVDIKNKHIKAVWRGSNDYNISINEDGYKDHVSGDHGGIIDIACLVEFGSVSPMNRQLAQERIGDFLGLTPKTMSHKRTYDYKKESTRYRDLVKRGFEEKAKYDYVDLTGHIRHFVIRMEHPTEHKQFIQATPYSGSLSDTETILYNLPVISSAEWAIVVEGEKDADTLIAWGLPGTTCNNGADNWKQSYTDTLTGKDVVICRDNDEAGDDHAKLVMRSLVHAAKTIRCICPSKLPKGDVTDWKEREGGTKDKLLEIIKQAPIITPDEAMWSDEALAIYKAKAANKVPFANYSVDARIVNGKEKHFFDARTITDMLADIKTRFLGFPRRLGNGTLFDHDRDTDRIEFLRNDASTFGWIGEKSRQVVRWKTGDGFVTKQEMHQSLIRNTEIYEKISSVPNYPKRPDVYYTYRNALKATEGHKAFDKFMSFFSPEDETSAVLMRAMVAAMMYYRGGIQRPCWIIDSHGGQAAGKTTFAELVCYLYNTNPIRTNQMELSRDFKELNKRLVSVTGRNAMMLLLDNLRGTFDDSNFADLVTCFSISGKAPYGIGEESRPNDLTYVITSNSVNIGADIASRSFILYIKPPVEKKPNWKRMVMDFVDKNRYEILGDVYDILSSPFDVPNFKPQTRVPDFEQEVLLKVSGTIDVYNRVIAAMLTNRSEANVDEERAILAEEAIRDGIKRVLDDAKGTLGLNGGAPIDVDNYIVFIRSSVTDLWLKLLHITTQDLRNYINIGRIDCFDTSISRYPSTKLWRARGLMFVGKHVIYDQFGTNLVYIITTKDDNGRPKAAIAKAWPDECYVRDKASACAATAKAVIGQPKSAITERTQTAAPSTLSALNVADDLESQIAIEGEF